MAPARRLASVLMLGVALVTMRGLGACVHAGARREEPAAVGSWVVVEVTDEWGLGLAGVWVRFVREDAGPADLTFELETDEAGNGWFGTLPPGEYRWETLKAGFGARKGTISVEATGRRVLRVTLLYGTLDVLAPTAPAR